MIYFPSNLSSIPFGLFLHDGVLDSLSGRHYYDAHTIWQESHWVGVLEKSQTLNKEDPSSYSRNKVSFVFGAWLSSVSLAWRFFSLGFVVLGKLSLESEGEKEINIDKKHYRLRVVSNAGEI